MQGRLHTLLVDHLHSLHTVSLLMHAFEAVFRTMPHELYVASAAYAPQELEHTLLTLNRVAATYMYMHESCCSGTVCLTVLYM